MSRLALRSRDMRADAFAGELIDESKLTLVRAGAAGTDSSDAGDGGQRR
jgi:hypothetical protein